MGNTEDQQSPAEVLRLEHKCVDVSGFKAHKSDGEDGLVEAIVSVTGLRDNVKDVIKPGAYEKSLKTRTPKGVWHHSWSESVSRTEDIKELLPGDPELPENLPNGQPWPKDAGALKVKTRFNLNTQRGREAYEDVIFFGDQQEWSIGYNVPVGGASVDSKSGVRTIHTLDLYEYSPVLFGAMPSARTSSVKEAQMAYKSLIVEDEAEEQSQESKAGEQDEDEEFDIFAEEDDLTPDYSDDDEDDDYDDEDDEGDSGEKMWGYLDSEGYFTKTAGPRQIAVGAGQAQKIYRAISSLSELLRDMRVDLEDDGELNNSAGGSDDAAGGEEDSEQGEQPDFENTTLSELASEVFEDDEDALSAAEDFDSAFEDEDKEGMEESAGSVIDAIEAAIEEGEDKASFTALGGYIAWAVEQVGDDEEGEEEEDPEEEDVDEEEEDSEDEEKSFYGDPEETFKINASEFKALLD